MSMNLSDALGDWPSAPGNKNQNQNQSGGAWPGQPANNPTWPGQPASNPTWPGQPANNPTWPGQPGQPSKPSGPGFPTGPGFPSQPSCPGFPSQPSGPGFPTGPGFPSQPSNPGFPSQPSNPGFPSHPSNPGFPSQPSNPGFPSHPSGPGSGPFPAAQTNLAVPFCQDIPGGLSEKKLITIRGTIKRNANRFNIDLLTRTGDICFHFNPRFREEARPVIVRNCCVNQKWGKEERDAPSFPFKDGENFEIKILVMHDCFKVAVNDRHLVDFRHRMNMRDVSRIRITEDVSLTGYNVETIH